MDEIAKKPIELKDLPFNLQQFSVVQAQHTLKDDLHSIRIGCRNRMERCRLFHKLQDCGFILSAGVMIKINDDFVPYLVTIVDYVTFSIQCTRYDFWLEGDKSFEIVDRIQNGKVLEVEGQIKKHLFTEKDLKE